ncbi:hypothetical protein AJ87_05545 [Rhizobium yanglingense]|nr:hypothetical protein AJ87_05545 [Rhizobium yanglingense]
MDALRTELREIKTSAQDRHFADDIREDMGRLAQSINQLSSRSAGPETAGLRNEFEELRSLMDGLAREDSIRHMERRWDGFENQLHALDTAGLQEELVSLAYRLDDIKRHIGGMGESPAVRALEDKLIAIATAMEQFGSMIQPHDRAMAEQFAAMDMRLDEISRAIAASGRSAASGDPALMHRLEGRLNALAEQIDMVGRSAESHALPAEGLADRLEMLTRRVEELANTKATARLDERLEQLPSCSSVPRRRFRRQISTARSPTSPARSTHWKAAQSTTRWRNGWTILRAASTRWTCSLALARLPMTVHSAASRGASATSRHASRKARRRPRRIREP